MSRRSSAAAPGMVSTDQVTPLSTVRSTVPRDPLTQTVLASTADSPRKLARVAMLCGTHPAANTTGTDSSTRRFMISTIASERSAPPQTDRENAIQADQRQTFQPDRLTIGHDQRDDQHRHQEPRH